MRDKIRLIMESSKMTQQEFAARLKISPASLSSIFTGRTNPTNTHVMAIHHAFPKINVNWLLFGEGKMYDDENAEDASPLEADETLLLEDCQNDSPKSSSGHSSASRQDFSPTQKPALHQSAHPQVYPPSGSREYRREDYEMVKMLDTKRRIKEIRVFYDDGTYESFSPSQR